MRPEILVIKLGALGDVLIAMGAMAAIRRAHPDARITLLTTPPFVDMLQRSGWFDEIWAEKRAPWNDLAGWLRLTAKLRSRAFDRVYDLQMNDRTRLIRLLLRGRPAWSGRFGGGALSYTGGDLKSFHAFERHRRVLSLAGIDVPLPDLSWMTADVTALAPPSPYVLLIPGCAPQHPRKRWPAVRYGALAVKLIREGYAVAAIGGPAEAEAIATIRLACPEVVDLSGKTSFYDIATLARGAAAAVGNDTGPTHLISLAGCPVVALFSGASSPELSAPVGPDVTVIQSDDLGDVPMSAVFDAIKFRKTASAA